PSGDDRDRSEGAMRTVWFQVRVHANSVEATERALGTPRGSSQASERVGYALNNYLVANGDPIPDACDQDGVSPTVACTHNPKQREGRWLLTTGPVDVPQAAVRAELWFAVE